MNLLLIMISNFFIFDVKEYYEFIIVDMLFFIGIFKLEK